MDSKWTDMVQDFEKEMVDMSRRLEVLKFGRKDTQIEQKRHQEQELQTHIQALVREDRQQIEAAVQEERLNTTECDQKIHSINSLTKKCERLEQKIKKERQSKQELESAISFMSGFLADSNTSTETKRVLLPRIQTQCRHDPLKGLDPLMEALHFSLQSKIDKNSQISKLLSSVTHCSILPFFQTQSENARRLFDQIKLRESP